MKACILKSELEFQQLIHFMAVANAKNFTRAAEEVGTSQSSLSRSIQKLETKIGEPLFERRPREVVLTDLGKLLEGRAEQILAMVDDTFRELTDSGKSGRVRLGVIPTIAPFLLPTVLSDFSHAFPNVSTIVQEDTTQNIIKLCNRGEIDLAILALPVTAKYLDVEPLFEEELVLVLPNGHRLEKKKSIKLEDVREFPFVMLDQAHCLSDNIASFCRRESLEPVSIERTSQLATVQELVSLSHGISMVPKMAQVLDQSDRRVYRSFAGEKPMRTIAVMTNPYRYQSKWVLEFLKHLRGLEEAT
ncbi:MAG: LysR family hydrogen peroxide-inducible transcriptional activator [Mariniblastus sp.]|jgi:LysR family hydrogen peroxide-inducible transcriptional activator